MYKPFALFPIHYFRIILTGWSGVFIDFIKIIFRFMKGMTVYQYLFAIACLSAGIANLFPWFYYQVDFLGTEDVFTGSDSKFILILIAPVGLSLLFIPISIKRKIFYISYAVIVITYLAGFIFENPIHTKMINPRDYTVLPVIYVYGVFLLLSGLLGYKSLEKSAVNYSWLFEPIAGAVLVEKERTNAHNPASGSSIKKVKSEESKFVKKEKPAKEKIPDNKNKNKIISDTKNSEIPSPSSEPKQKISVPGAFSNFFSKKERTPEKNKSSSKKHLNIKIAK